MPDVDFVKPNPVILHLVPVTADAVPVIIIFDLLYLLGAAILALVFSFSLILELICDVRRSVRMISWKSRERSSVLAK